MKHVERLIIIIIFCLSLVRGAAADRPADLPSLEQDIADGYLDEYSKIEAAFILSGITGADSLKEYTAWYDKLVAKIKSFAFDFNDPVGSARTVFMYLHTEWLQTYAEESTTLTDIVRNREFNCVAATILYNIICEEFNWSCQAFETPTHVYTIFNNFRQNLLIENTSNMGFDIMQNLKAYSRYLAQYYPQSEVLRIGLDRLYLHENSNGRMINNTELLGLLAYNRAYLAKKEENYETAYDYVLLAQKFNQDSRSNINFEIGLYYAWGRQLYTDGDHSSAFEVFADGYYRYPDNEVFLNNTITSFYKSMQMNWSRKNWQESSRLIDEIILLKVLRTEDFHNLTQLLISWRQYFIKNEKSSLVNEVDRYLKKINP